MARRVASCLSPVILFAAAAAFAPTATADRKQPAPIEYVSWGQGSHQGQAASRGSSTVPTPNSSATRDAWRGPVTKTGAASLPQSREKVDFVYPGSAPGKASRQQQQYASVDPTPRASRPDVPTRLWPAEATASPLEASKAPAIQSLTLSGERPAHTSSATPVEVEPRAAGVSHQERGLASWYGEAFHGQPTANGEIFDMDAMTAAHKTLPLPSLVQVINQETGKEIVVRVNDRGPFAEGRIIDLSKRAASAIGIVEQGEAPVMVRYLGPAPAIGQAQPQYAQAMTVSENKPAAYQEASRRVSRPDLYGDMLLGGAEPTLGVPDPGQTVATPANPDTVTNKAQDYSPSDIQSASLPPLRQEAPQPARRIEAAASPSTQTRSSFSPGLYVQIGAFSDIGNAQGRHAQVGGQFPVKVEDVRMNGADYFRVLVGPFPTRDAAERARVQLRTRGVSESFVTLR